MAIFASFVHCLPNILHTWPHDSFYVIRLSMTLGIFQGHWTVSHQISQNGVWYGKSYCRQLIGNHTLPFDWCHFWWPWSTFEGHFSQGCHFRVHFSNPWHAFASHSLPAIAELLVDLGPNTQNLHLQKIAYKWACMADRPEIFRPTMGGFRGWPIQWNHAKCCGANPCCHGN